jgi:hypothetical protein
MSHPPLSAIRGEEEEGGGGYEDVAQLGAKNVCRHESGITSERERQRDRDMGGGGGLTCTEVCEECWSDHQRNGKVSQHLASTDKQAWWCRWHVGERWVVVGGGWWVVGGWQRGGGAKQSLRHCEP